MAAKDPAAPNARAALADLCRVYWYPVYAYVRRRGHDHHAAQDLTQAFFARLLEKHDLAAADRTRGRFRSYLLAACQHFLANEHVHRNADKRGGGVAPLSIDADAWEAALPLREPATDEHPEVLFERQWALTVLARALEALEKESAVQGRSAFFEKVKPLLNDAVDHGAQTQIAEACGMNVAALRMALHRLRRRLREFVKAEVAGTLDDPALVHEEMQALFAALGG